MDEIGVFWENAEEENGGEDQDQTDETVEDGEGEGEEEWTQEDEGEEEDPEHDEEVEVTVEGEDDKTNCGEDVKGASVEGAGIGGELGGVDALDKECSGGMSHGSNAFHFDLCIYMFVCVYVSMCLRGGSGASVDAAPASETTRGTHTSPAVGGNDSFSPLATPPPKQPSFPNFTPEAVLASCQHYCYYQVMQWHHVFRELMTCLQGYVINTGGC